MSDRYGYSIEYILWYVRDTPFTFNKVSRPHYLDIFTDKVAVYKKTDHPAEKPLHLIEALVKTHSNQGDIVLDPFLGSGTTAVACVKSNRRYIGMELLPKYYEMALMRLETETKQPTLWGIE
jgi:DNA modification methylase